MYAMHAEMSELDVCHSNEDIGPHPALLNIDVLRIIFEFFLEFPDIDGKQISKRNLLNTALTCKCFTEPALDVMWSSIPCLIPLLKLIPAFKQFGGIYLLHGNVSEEDWTYFRQYARRVKALVFDSGKKGNPIVSHTTYLRLSQSQRDPLLPRLRHISCSFSNLKNLDIFPFLSPSIQSIEVREITAETDVVIYLLSVLALEARTLRHLSLNGGLSSASLHWITQLECLRSLELKSMGHSIDNSVLTWIGNLKHLDTLSIDLIDSPTEQNMTCSGFLHLTSLDILGSLQTITTFLTRLETSSLESLSVFERTVASGNPWTGGVQLSPWYGGDRNWPEAEWRRCFSIILDKWSPSLRAISIERQQMYPKQIDVFQILGSFYRLRAMESVRLQAFCRTIVMSKVDIVTMARSWPNIRELHILPEVVNNDISLTDIRALTDSCPYLTSLSLSVNLKGIPERGLDAASTTPHSGLRSLSIGGSHLDACTVPFVIKYMVSLFPRLEHLTTFGCIDQQKREELKTLLRSYQSAQADEQVRQVTTRKGSLVSANVGSICCKRLPSYVIPLISGR